MVNTCCVNNIIVAGVMKMENIVSRTGFNPTPPALLWLVLRHHQRPVPLIPSLYGMWEVKDPLSQ